MYVNLPFKYYVSGKDMYIYIQLNGHKVSQRIYAL